MNTNSLETTIPLQVVKDLAFNDPDTRRIVHATWIDISNGCYNKSKITELLLKYGQPVETYHFLDIDTAIPSELQSELQMVIAYDAIRKCRLVLRDMDAYLRATYPVGGKDMLYLVTPFTVKQVNNEYVVTVKYMIGQVSDLIRRMK